MHRCGSQIVRRKDPDTVGTRVYDMVIEAVGCTDDSLLRHVGAMRDTQAHEGHAQPQITRPVFLDMRLEQCVCFPG